MCNHSKMLIAELFSYYFIISYFIFDIVTFEINHEIENV